MPAFGLIIIGDEILSGRRQDKHMTRTIELLAERGQSLSWCQYVGDEPARITDALRQAMSSGDIVFSCGGIGATPDDHTRACAAAAAGQDLALHPEAKRLIQERIQDMARETGQPYEPDRPDNLHRLNMGVFPANAQIIPNPYNKIPGFSLGDVHFLPGFPVMAHPMMAWVLDQRYGHLVPVQWQELSVYVYEAMESTLTPLMERVEAEHPGVKVFSLPSVDHPQRGRHIELGVKGEPKAAQAAFVALQAGLSAFAGIRVSTT
ncbi:competence/damage-inducible protein A [Ideonella livida]|uniref:Competence/damage-inducible protein A n=1 Tax=Ideonella livida TaxID=2707176 RepID=A0A7C9PG37_9BURK|nr:molybdopterin-binding protein [Ideonella livida]NDY90572.1 competence/damage-inducible protein A [Ideonella livida]